MNESPEIVDNKVDDIIDIDLSVIEKKRFRIDGNNDRILELNTSDLSVITRLESSYDRLKKLGSEANSLSVDKDLSDDEDIMTDEKFSNLAKSFTKIDKEMRDIIDYVFDSNVSEVCAPSGSMFDPINGEFRYEHIINKILTLYDANFTKEFEQIKKRVGKHTNKYVGRK